MTDTHTTAHIPDEAIQAVASTIMVTNEEAYDVIKAILPHLSAPCAVEVKGLDWVEVSYGFIAHTAFGLYKITCDVDQFTMVVVGSEFPASFHDNHLDAKAAAQADFEHRILSCVVTKSVDVAAVREQALDEAARIADDGMLVPPDGGSPTKEEVDVALRIAAAIRARSPAEPAQAEQWQPTHRHVKRGTEYQLIGTGKMQAEKWYEYPCERPVNSIDMQEIAIYRGDDGQLWVRPIEEFNDGRFETLPAAPTTEAGK